MSKGPSKKVQEEMNTDEFKKSIKRNKDLLEKNKAYYSELDEQVRKKKNIWIIAVSVILILYYFLM